MLKEVSFEKTEVTSGFWKQKQDMVKNTTINAVYDRFKETGRFDALKCLYKEGDEIRPHIFWDSDVAKWIEGAAYVLRKKRNKRLEKLIDQMVADVCKNQEECGYFNSYYLVCDYEKRFTDRDKHELYCLGHWIEGAIAYYEATGKDALLNACKKYVAYVEKRFVIDKDTVFVTPGHEELELALYKLYKCTGDKKYLDLSLFFVNSRGHQDEGTTQGGWNDSFTPYNQSHVPVREQKEAVGHSVRATYLYCAMADLAKETGDAELLDSCKSIFDNIINRRMYITGGIGSSGMGERFSFDYDLCNLIAYTETCAAIGLALFAHRMQLIENDSKYADVIERVIYNGFMSSISLSGDEFFYQNPLEVLPFMHKRELHKNKTVKLPRMTRQKVFSCSCCPPNIVRFIPSIANFLYTTDEDTLYVHQFMQSKTELEIGGKRVKITQRTNYPESGKIHIKVEGADLKVAVRIPGWYEDYTKETVNGYAYFDVNDGESVDLDFKMRARLVESRPELIYNCARYAVTYGPVIYCGESVDNGANIRDIRIDSRAKFVKGVHEALNVPMLSVKAYRRRPDENAPIYSYKHDSLAETTLRLIPYYAFANRGEAEMQVWFFVK